MQRSFALFGAAALAAAATGCLPQTPGELDNGSFTYFCAGDDDLACTNDLFNASGVPEAIAVGAHFDLQFDPDGASSDAVLTPASRGILSTDLSLDSDTTGFRFTSPGTVAILAKRGNQVIDFVHVTGALLDRVTLSDETGDLVTQMSISKSTYNARIAASPRDDLGNILAGTLHYTWTSSDTDVVSVDEGFAANEVSLYPRATGKATITVDVEGMKSSVEVSVGGAP